MHLSRRAAPRPQCCTCRTCSCGELSFYNMCTCSRSWTSGVQSVHRRPQDPAGMSTCHLTTTVLAACARVLMSTHRELKHVDACPSRWATAPPSLRVTLWMLLADLPPTAPLLLLATADVPLSELDPEAAGWCYCESYHCEACSEPAMPPADVVGNGTCRVQGSSEAIPGHLQLQFRVEAGPGEAAGWCAILQQDGCAETWDSSGTSHLQVC